MEATCDIVSKLEKMKDNLILMVSGKGVLNRDIKIVKVIGYTIDTQKRIKWFKCVEYKIITEIRIKQLDDIDTNFYSIYRSELSLAMLWLWEGFLQMKQLESQLNKFKMADSMIKQSQIKT